MLLLFCAFLVCFLEMVILKQTQKMTGDFYLLPKNTKILRYLQMCGFGVSLSFPGLSTNPYTMKVLQTYIN
jgi:hypothetical protein